MPPNSVRVTSTVRAPKSAARRAAFAARGDEPTLLRLRNEGGTAGAGERRDGPFETLALFVGRHTVDFRANDPLAELIVAAALEAADEAGEIEVACNAGAN
jgi:hypothetical protein